MSVMVLIYSGLRGTVLNVILLMTALKLNHKYSWKCKIEILASIGIFLQICFYGEMKKNYLIFGIFRKKKLKKLLEDCNGYRQFSIIILQDKLAILSLEQHE